MVTFYTNGDHHKRGLQTSVSGKHFATMECLLSWLNEKVAVINGVKKVLRVPDGAEIEDVAQFQSGGWVGGVVGGWVVGGWWVGE